MQVTTITIPKRHLLDLIERDLNANVFRVPLRVTDIDSFDDKFIVDVESHEPTLEEAAADAKREVATVAATISVAPPINGNGHHSGKGKHIITEDDKAEIYRLADLGWGAQRIAQAIGKCGKDAIRYHLRLRALRTPAGGA